MSFSDEYGPFLILGAGLVMLSLATKRKPRVHTDRSGETCVPGEDVPEGYECEWVDDGVFELRAERGNFVGYGPYPSRKAVDNALSSLGFPGANLAGFQRHMTLISTHDLRQDGVVDRDTVLALKEAEGMLERGIWTYPAGEG